PVADGTGKQHVTWVVLPGGVAHQSGLPGVCHREGTFPHFAATFVKDHYRCLIVQPLDAVIIARVILDERGNHICAQDRLAFDNVDVAHGSERTQAHFSTGHDLDHCLRYVGRVLEVAAEGHRLCS